MTNGEEYDLTDHDSIDENLWWELDMEIKDMVKGVVIAITDSFGIEFDDIYLQWG